MVVAFRQYERRAAGAQRLDHVVADPLIARIVGDQLPVQTLELETLVGVRLARGPKRSWLNQRVMLERAGSGLNPCIDAVPDRPAGARSA